MQLCRLQHVSVWLEDRETDDKVFRHALDWAFRLNLPLRAVVACARHPSNRDPSEVGGCDEDVPRHGMPVDRLQAWGNACTQNGVALETFMWIGKGDAGPNQFMRTGGLCVLADGVQEDVLRRSGQILENAVLLCSPTCMPLTRILVLFDQSNPNPFYLESVARLCKSLDICPIILIVANSEREADVQRGYAEGVCRSFRLHADYDFVVGCDLSAAICRVASWRRCSHLIVARRIESFQRQSIHDPSLAVFPPVSDAVSLLALPEASVLDVPRTIRGERLDLAAPALLP